MPFGRYVRIAYTRDFTPYQDAFHDWTYTDADFETIPLARTDFVYADPPYDVEFTTYSKGGFSWDDQVRTAEWLARHKGPVILVNQATPRIRELYGNLGYDIRLLDGGYDHWVQAGNPLETVLREPAPVAGAPLTALTSVVVPPSSRKTLPAAPSCRGTRLVASLR